VAESASRFSLRLVRWAEVAYTLVAFFFLTGLPAPNPHTALTWVHWLGTGVVAALIAFRLRRPDRTMLMVAAILGVYVLVNAAWALPRLLALFQDARNGPMLAIALLAAAVIWGSQVTVIVTAMRARRFVPAK
jgi:hypothetical protein